MQAASGQVMEMQTVTGPTSYPNGDGFTVQSDLGRVDNFIVQTDSGTIETRNDSVVNNNQMVVKAYTANTSGNTPYDEVTNDNDLSGDNFTLFASKL